MSKVVIGNARGSRGGVHLWRKGEEERKQVTKMGKWIKIKRARELKKTCIKQLSSLVVA